MTDQQRKNGGERIWLLRTTYLTAYLEALRGNGVDPASLLHRHGIPPDFEYLPGYMLAAGQLHSFIRDASRSAEPGSISTAAGLYNSAHQPNPFRDAEGISVTLLDAIQRHNTAAAGYSPENVFRLKMTDTAGLWQKVGVSPLDETEMFCIANLIGHVRNVLGDRWQPHTVAVSKVNPALLRRLPMYGGIQVLASVRHTTLEIPNHLLAAPIRPRKVPAVDSTPALQLQSANRDFVWSLRQLLKSYVRLGATGIDSVADAVGLTRRTLQRRLAAAGITYSAVLDQARFEVARSMLIDSPETGITEIAYEIGYRDPGSFSRAFRRLAGTTPRDYRLFSNERHAAI